MAGEDALLQVLIDIDEQKSISNMSVQLQRVAMKIKDMKIKVDIDDSSFKQIQAKLAEFEAKIGANQEIKLSSNNLTKNFQTEINQALEKYEHLGATVKRVSTDATGDLSRIILTVKDLSGNLKTIALDKSLNEVGSNFAPGLDSTLKTIQGEIGKTEKALKQITKAMAGGFAAPDSEAQMIGLLDQLNIGYSKLGFTIDQSTVISEERRRQLQAGVLESRKATDAAIAFAQAEGTTEKSIKKVNQALVDYKRELATLTKVKLGEDTSQSEADVQTRLTGLREIANGYESVTTEMNKQDIVQDRLYNTKLVANMTTEFHKQVAAVESIGKSLNKAQKGLLDAELKGDAKQVIDLTAQVKNLEIQFDAAANKGAEIGNKLNLSDDVAKLAQTEEALRGVRQEIVKATDNASELNQKFGTVMTASASGKDMGQLAKQFKESSVQTKEFAQSLLGTGASIKRVYNESSKYQQMTKVMQVSVKEADGVHRLYNITLDQTNNQLRMTGGAVDSANHKVKGFSNQVLDAAKKIGLWGVSTKIVYGSWQAFQAGIEVVKDLDKELTQIAVVSGQTRESVKYLGDEYAETAVKMAHSVLEVAKLNTELVRQGLSIEEAAKRADTIMKLSSAGNISMEQSLQVITTGVNALGEAHTKVADVILKAANLSASDVEGLGEAFSKTASGAKAAGMSIEETTSLLATMKDITQEGDSQLGTSLKSLLARFNKINEETGEFNTELNTVQTAIESVGIAFTDSEGQIRNVYDILEDLSGSWDTLDKNTKSYIATQAAGVRQQNRFFAIMDNFNQVQAMNNDLTNAAGTLQASYGTYLESTEAAAVRLKATLDKLWINFISSDFLIFLSEAATGFVRLADAMGIVGIVALGVVAKLSFKPAIAGIAAMATQFKVLNAEVLMDTATGLKYFTDGTAALTGGTVTLSQSLANFGTVAAAGFAKATTAVGAFMAVAWPYLAIAAAIAAIVWFTGKQKKEHQEKLTALSEERKAMEDMQGSYYSDQASIQSLGEKYLEYQNKISSLGSVLALTKEETAEYYGIQTQLQELIPSLVMGEDRYGNAILSNVTSVGQLTAAHESLLKAKQDAVASDVSGQLEAVNETYKDEAESLLKLQILMKRKADLEKTIEKDRGRKGVNFRPQDEIELAEVEKSIENLKTKEGPAFAQWGRETAAIVLTEFENMDAKIRQFILNSNLTEQFAGLDVAQIRTKITEITQYLQNTKIRLGGETLDYSGLMTKLEIMKEQIGRSITAEEYLAAIAEVAPQIEAALGKLDKNDFGTDMAQAYVANLNFMKVSADELTSAAAESMEANLTAAKESYNTAGEAALEYYEDLQILNKAEVGSAELQDLILSKYPQWAYMMGDKVALSQAFQGAMLSEDQARASSYINMLLNTSTFLTETGGAYQNLMANLAGFYGSDIKNYQQLESVKGLVTADLINKLTAQWGKYFNLVGDMIVVDEGLMRNDLLTKVDAGQMSFAQMEQTIKNARSGAAAATQNIKKVTIALDTFKASIKVPDFKNFSKDLGNIGKKAGSSPGGAAKGIDEAAEAVKKLNEEMKAIQDTTKKVFDFALEYIEWVEEQKRNSIVETYESEQKLQEDMYDKKADDLEDEKDKQLEILDIKEDAIKAEEEALEYMQKRSELQDNLVNLEYQLAIASLDSSVAGATRRRTLEQQLAEERANLIELEKDRENILQEEAFARQRKFVETQAEYERMLAETAKTDALARNQQVHDAKIAALDTEYSDEQKYLMAVQATQSGMIENLTGQMIPLVQAFKELAIENGKFWTFFGQQEVAEFGNAVTTTLEAIKRLGFETIQMWKEVAAAANAASSASSSASSAGTGASSPVSNPAPAPAPAPASTASAAISQTSLNKQYQTWLNSILGSIGLSGYKLTTIDGVIGTKTKTASYAAANNTRTSASMDSVLRAVAGAARVSTSQLSLLRGMSLGGSATTSSSYAGVTNTRPTMQAYSEGGKIDYTGPAAVHGSKSRPEYVFNYAQFQDLAKMIAKHELVKMPIKSAVTPNGFQLNIDNLIHVEGSVDKESLPELKRISNDAITQLTNKLKGWGK